MKDILVNWLLERTTMPQYIAHKFVNMLLEAAGGDLYKSFDIFERGSGYFKREFPQLVVKYEKDNIFEYFVEKNQTPGTGLKRMLPKQGTKLFYTLNEL